MMNGNDGYMRAGLEADARTFACFVTHPVLNGVKSAEQGRPILEGVPYFRQERIGERDVLMRAATEDDKRRHPEAWRAYEEKREQAPAGTPLSVLFPQYPEIVATLEYSRIKTVEQLAALSDIGMQNVGMGAREWRNKADEFLRASQGAGAFHALKAEQEKAQATIEKLTAQVAMLETKLAEKSAATPHDDIAELKAQMALLMSPKRGPGRPPKAEIDE